MTAWQEIHATVLLILEIKSEPGVNASQMERIEPPRGKTNNVVSDQV